MGKAKVKGKERKVETEIAKPNLCATIGARVTATAASYAPACNFSHDGPQGGDKRKREKGSTSLPAKAVKRAKKEIMAMCQNSKSALNIDRLQFL